MKYIELPESLKLSVDHWFRENTGLGGCSDADVQDLSELFYGVVFGGGRESVEDALAVINSFGPGIGGLNDAFARQILLAEEVKRLRAAVEADRAQRVPDGKPMFWVRLCSDGMYEGPIHDKQLEDVRRNSGAWSPLYLASTPAPAQQSGWTEESGLVLDFANRVELSCYDQGSAECMAAVQEILDGKDRGDGVANEPWESIRRRLISLVAPAPAQQERSNAEKLAVAIAEAATKVGITDAASHSFSGPQLLMLLEDMVEMICAKPQQERKPMTHIKEQARSYQVAQLAPTTGMVAISSAAYIELYERHHGIKE